jgi:hypothetical protein
MGRAEKILEVVVWLLIVGGIGWFFMVVMS